MRPHCTQTPEDMEEAEEDSEAEVRTPMGEETEEARTKISHGSRASTVEGRDTRPQSAQAQRGLEMMDERMDKEVAKEGTEKPLQQQTKNLTRPGWP